MRPLRTSGVSPVIAVILLVAITVVLTAVLYIIVQDIAKQAEEPAPNVFIGDEQHPDPGNTTFSILGVSEPRTLANFKASLFIDGTDDTPSTMNPLATGTRGRLTFQDFDAGGTLSQGDKFRVAVQPGHTYELAVFWKGTLTHSVTWQT